MMNHPGHGRPRRRSRNPPLAVAPPTDAPRTSTSTSSTSTSTSTTPPFSASASASAPAAAAAAPPPSKRLWDPPAVTPINTTTTTTTEKEPNHVPTDPLGGVHHDETLRISSPPDPPALADELDDDENDNNNDDDDDYEEEKDYVPHSMKEFLEAAHRELDANLRGLLDDDHPHEEGGVGRNEDSSTTTFFSPPLTASTGYNPTVELTHTTARHLALEGVTPPSPSYEEEEHETFPEQVTLNLLLDLEDAAAAAAIRETPTMTTAVLQVTKTGLVSVSAAATATNTNTTMTVDPPPRTPPRSVAAVAAAAITTPDNGWSGSKATPSSQLEPRDTHWSTRIMEEEEEEENPSSSRRGQPPSPLPRPLEIAFERAARLSSSSSSSSSLMVQEDPPSSRLVVVPRLLQGTVTSRARTRKDVVAVAVEQQSSGSPFVLSGRNKKEDHHYPSKKKEITSPDDKISSRLLQGTTSSKARMAFRERLRLRTKEATDQTTTTTKAGGRQPRGGGGGGKPLSARLLQPTVSTRVYVASSPTAKRHSTSSSTMLPRRMPNDSSDEMFQESHAHLQQQQQQQQEDVQKYIQMEKAKDVARQRALEEQFKEKQRLQVEKRIKMQASLQRAKEKRLAQDERLKQNQATLFIKQAEAQERVQVRQRAQQLLVEEKQKLESRKKKTGTEQTNPDDAAARKVARVTKIFHPTVPIAPSFMTDARMKQQKQQPSSSSKLHANSILPLAASDTLLMKTLRSPTSAAANHPPRRGLTIPVGPTFSKQRQPRHISPPPKRWESELRNSSSNSRAVPSSTASAASSPERSTTAAASSSFSSRLTIPQTPQFSEMKRRPLPKSTAEREAEEMEYFQSHPFKAQPVRMNATSSSSLSVVQIPSRPSTTPSPFVLRTEVRSQSARRRSGSTGLLDDPAGGAGTTPSDIRPFKARPVPDFSKSTPLTGRRPVTRRPFTTPEPFQFHTDVRVQERSLLSSNRHHDDPETPVQFKARPMPHFVKPPPTPRISELDFPRRFSPPHSTSRRTQPEEPPFQFKARPMPEFFKEVPNVISWSDVMDRSWEDETVVQPFRARPMPNFDKPTVPVKPVQRIRSTPSPAPVENVPTPFRARKLPHLSSGPAIPVRDRNPQRLLVRSPAGDTALATTTTSQDRRLPSKENKRPPSTTTNPPFKARPTPTSSPPRIPVRERHASSLPSRTGSSTARRLPQQSPTAVTTPPPSRRDHNSSSSSPSAVRTTTPTLSSPKWLSSRPRRPTPPASLTNYDNSAAMDRLRQRLKDRTQQNGTAAATTTSSGTLTGKSRFSSAQVRSQLAKVAPMASPEGVPGSARKESSSSSTKHNSHIESSATITDDESTVHSTTHGVQGGQTSTTSVHPSPRPDKMRLVDIANARSDVDVDDPTPRSGTGVGPTSFGDPMDRLVAGEAKRREQNRLAAAQWEEAMQLAMDVQRAAEDELSYHESSVDHGRADHYDDEFPLS